MLGPKCKIGQIVASPRGQKVGYLSLLFNLRVCQVDLGVQGSNPGVCNRPKIIKKKIMEGCKLCIYSLNNYIIL